MINQKPYLEFNDYPISFQFEDGIWWIAAKDICEALDVQWKHQHQKLLADPILKSQIKAKSIYRISGQPRSMVCIPEKFVYGWIFQLDSSKPGVRAYKWKCYELLYDHFKGTLSQRQTILKERSATDIKISELKNKIEESYEWKQIEELKKKKTTYNRKLNNLDIDLISKQGDLFNQS